MAENQTRAVFFTSFPLKTVAWNTTTHHPLLLGCIGCASKVSQSACIPCTARVRHLYPVVAHFARYRYGAWPSNIFDDSSHDPRTPDTAGVAMVNNPLCGACPTRPGYYTHG
jgi:hypothetical protein